jgi:hypothetical protein
MKKLLDLWRPEEERGRHAPFQTITSCKRSFDYGLKNYVILVPESNDRLQLVAF